MSDRTTGAAVVAAARALSGCSAVVGATATFANQTVKTFDNGASFEIAGALAPSSIRMRER